MFVFENLPLEINCIIDEYRQSAELADHKKTMQKVLNEVLKASTMIRITIDMAEHLQDYYYHSDINIHSVKICSDRGISPPSPGFVWRREGRTPQWDLWYRPTIGKNKLKYRYHKYNACDRPFR